MNAKRNPQQPGKARQGQKQKHPENHPTTRDAEAQALRLAIRRFSRSKTYYRGKLLERQEALALFQSHPSPEAVQHTALQELKVQHAASCLAEVEAALSLFYRLFLQLEDGGA